MYVRVARLHLDAPVKGEHAPVDSRTEPGASSLSWVITTSRLSSSGVSSTFGTDASFPCQPSLEHGPPVALPRRQSEQTV